MALSVNGEPISGAGMSNPMTTAGDLITGGASGTPTRLGVGAEGRVLTVSSGVPAWVAPASSGVSIGTAGADAARPAASTGLNGSLYTGTDTAVRYLCESDGSGGARWCVVGRHHYEGRDTTCARLGTTRSATSDVATVAATILSGAIVLSVGTLPSGGTVLVSCTAAVTGYGWHIRIGDDPAGRGRLVSYRVGMGSEFAYLTSAEAAADNALHCLAWTWDGVTVRYSWDGATVATATHTSGTMTAGTGFIRFGAVSGGTFAPDADLGAVKLWSTAVGDADLEAAALAGSTTGRIPDPAGATCVYDHHPGRHAEGIVVQPCVRGTAQRMTWSAAPPMVIR